MQGSPDRRSSLKLESLKLKEMAPAPMRATLRRWAESLRSREDQLTILLSLLIGVLVGLVVVAFILLTGRLAANMYPAGGAAWRRVVIPTVGSLVTGFLLYKYFPNARGSGTTGPEEALRLILAKLAHS